MSLAAHRIRRLRWTLRATSTEQAFALRRDIREQLDDRLLPALARGLDAVDRDGEVVHVPRLELKLRVDSPEALRRELAELVERELAAALLRLERERVDQRPLRRTLAEARRDELWRYLDTGSVPALAHAPRVELLERAREHRVATLEWLARRSATAWFRWLALAEPHADAGAGLRDLLPFELADALARAAAASLQSECESMVARVLVDAPMLAHHLRLRLAAELLSAWSRGDTTAVRELTRQTRRVLADASSREREHEHAHASESAATLRVADLESLRPTPGASSSSSSWSSSAAGGQWERSEAMERPVGSRERSDDIDDVACAESTPRTERSRSTAASPTPPSSNSAGHTHDPTRPIPQARDTTPRDALASAKLAAPAHADARLGSETLAAATSPHADPPATPSPDPRAELRPASTTDEPLAPHVAPPWLTIRTPTSLATPVRSAGLVLLHPFIPTLFARVGLAPSGRTPLSDQALPIAAALLHHLATGETAPLEPQLGLIKLMLGLRIDVPLLVGDDLLAPHVRDEAEQVLRAAIDHWRALGHISIAGFRTTFLQRAGIVRELSGGASLMVEPGPFDMLLDRLPWGLSIVKFAWMTRPLFVEWTPT